MWLKNPKVRKSGAVVLFLVAVAVLLIQLLHRDDPLDEVPDAEELRAAWACEHCGEVFYFTPRERIERQMKGAKVTVGGRAVSDPSFGEEGRTSTRDLVLLCPKCGKLEVRRAVICPTCGTAFARFLSGERQSCPSCGWTRAEKQPGRRQGKSRRPTRR
jgi:predicted RNA-binding Zn-ribbon protein involved in translation (DUF1610 family)